MRRVCLQFVIVVFPDHTHLLYLYFVIILVYCLAFSNCDSRANIMLIHNLAIPACDKQSNFKRMILIV